MWSDIIEKFNKYPSQQKVIIKLVQLGLRVSDNKKIYCDDIEINISSLAKTLNTDRRVVIATIENILSDKTLKKIFMNLTPSGPMLSDISSELGLGVIEIEGSAKKPGILNEVTKILSDKKISIRQAYASDPELDPLPHLTIITDKPVEGNMINLLLKIDGITKVSLY